MGTLQVGHGSEYHLLRFMGRHRGDLNAAIKAQVDTDSGAAISAIDWVDFPYKKKTPNAPTGDGEILSVDFLSDHGGAAWRDYWPDRRPGVENRPGVPSWDAIGKVTFEDGEIDWLLVEAKAHLAEFASAESECGAGEKSRTKITNTLGATYSELATADSPPWEDVRDGWLGRYYQLANRLAVLRFLRTHSHRARLLYIFFAGDSYRECPSTGSKWMQQVTTVYTAMGLPEKHSLSSWCHYVTLDVATGRRV